jgi:hypothetical protein
MDVKYGAISILLTARFRNESIGIESKTRQFSPGYIDRTSCTNKDK